MMAILKRLDGSEVRGLSGKEELNQFIDRVKNDLPTRRAQNAGPDIFISLSDERKIRQLIDRIIPNARDKNQCVLCEFMLDAAGHLQGNARGFLSSLFDEIAGASDRLIEEKPSRNGSKPMLRIREPGEIGTPFLDWAYRPGRSTTEHGL